MKKQLTPQWLIGFIDGDGYFGLQCVKTKKKNSSRSQTYGFYRPILAISQKNPMVLYKIKSFIGCGSVSLKGKNKDQYHYRIRTASLFIKFFYPIVQGFKFQTNKQIQFEILMQAVWFLSTTYQSINSIHQAYVQHLDHRLRQVRLTDYDCCFSLTPQWIIGFFEAEGCFDFSFDWQSDTIKSIRFLFKITQKNKCLLEKIQQWFGYGTIQQETPGIYNFQITRFDLIETQLVPFLEKQCFHSHKNYIRIKWLKAFRLIQTSKQAQTNHCLCLSRKQLEKIIGLKQTLNQII